MWTWREYEKSLEAYKKAIEIDPENVDAWINKGNLLTYLGIYSRALKAYDEVIAFSPKNTRAWISKGVAFILPKNTLNVCKY